MPNLRPSKKALRNWAADCYIRANRNAREAVELLLAEIDGKFRLPRANRFCRRWGERRIATGGVGDAPRSGRPKKLTEEWVDACITALSQGYERMDASGPKRVPFRTWTQFCQNCPTAIACLAATGVIAAHLLRACMLALPTLKRVKIQVRVWLKPEIKQQRVTVSNLLLAKPVEWFNAVVWLDCKTLYINPTSSFAWVNTAAMSPHDLVREDRRCRARGKELVRLKFYIAVNALLGPVALIWVTGTTGLTYDRRPPPYRPYQVITEEALLCSSGCSAQSHHSVPVGAPAPPRLSASTRLHGQGSAASPAPNPPQSQQHSL